MNEEVNEVVVVIYSEEPQLLEWYDLIYMVVHLGIL